MWNKVCSGLFNSGKKYLFWPLKIAAISIFLFTLLVHLLFVKSIFVSFYIRIIGYFKEHLHCQWYSTFNSKKQKGH